MLSERQVQSYTIEVLINLKEVRTKMEKILKENKKIILE